MTEKKAVPSNDAVSTPSFEVAAAAAETELDYIGIRKATLGIPDNIDKEYFDPVVASLAEEDRPQVEVVCQHCPGACFFTTHNALNCFCKHMNTVSWGFGLPPITRCTAQGLFVAQWKAKMAEKA